MPRFFILILLCLIGTIVQSQPMNDECRGAIRIDNATNFCSPVNEYTNVDATQSNYGPAGCFNEVTRDVWFSFVALATDVSIIIKGNIGEDSGGTLTQPQAALYSGSCGGTLNEWKCLADLNGNNIIELNQSGLILGMTHYIRVDGINGSAGTFQLCIRNFQPPVAPGQDCNTASVLCDTTAFVVQTVTGAGQDPDEARNSCLGVLQDLNSEQQSTWFKWEAANDGMLEFTLTPLDSRDDIDFVVYELPGGLDDCANKVVLRCMATACLGPTGLNLSSTDDVEDSNCDAGEDGFVRAVQMETGKAYALLVNNFTSSGVGFSFEFGGTAEFAGPIPDFEIVPEQAACGDTITLNDLSVYPNGSISGYNWLFGEDANIPSSNQAGPNEIVYNSFGPKYVLLQIESDKGCLRSEIKRIDIDTCCAALGGSLTLDVINQNDLTCYNIPDGLIEVAGNSPYSSDYLYEFNGDGDFSPLFRFEDLEVGMYSILVQDRFGCLDSTTITLTQPEEIIVDAGEDQSSNLGEFITLEATYTPGGLIATGMWTSSNGDTISCLDPLCLSVSVLPPGPTEYIIAVVDEDGCVGKGYR